MLIMKFVQKFASILYYNWEKKYATQKKPTPNTLENVNTKPMGLFVEQTLDIQVLGYPNKMTSCTQIRIILRPSSSP